MIVYLTLNCLITVVGFAIYKLCYISEQKTKYINIYRILVNEYIKIIKENKTFQKCTILMKVKKLYTKWKINKCFQKDFIINCIEFVYISGNSDYSPR